MKLFKGLAIFVAASQACFFFLPLRSMNIRELASGSETEINNAVHDGDDEMNRSDFDGSN